jgi:hypothetical protein
MRRFRLPLLGLVCACLCTAQAATHYFVATDGDDANPGTAQRPWASLHKAAATAEAGDTVFIGGGTYRIDRPIEPAHSGRPDAWITYIAAPSQRYGDTPSQVIVDASAWLPKARFWRNGYGAIHINDRSYLRFQGIAVHRSHGMGFFVEGGKPHHLDFIDCGTLTTFGCGIGLWNAEYIRVLGCTVRDATTNRMRLWGDPREEAPHEAISVAGVNHFEVAYCWVEDVEKEGIDVKEVSANGRVHHNFVRNALRQGIYADAWFGVLHDVEIDHNIVRDCDLGISVSVEHETSELRNVSIHHNVVTDCTGPGLFFSRWGADRIRTGVRVFNNTFVHNGSVAHWSGPTGNIDLRSPSLQDVEIYNNIAVGGAAFDIATFDDPATGLKELAAKKIRIHDNLIGTFFDKTGGPWMYARTWATRGENPREVDPQFFDTEHGVYYLRADSPARGAGRGPNGEKVDLGAYAFGEELAELPAPEVERPVAGVLRLRVYTAPGYDYALQIRDDAQDWCPPGPYGQHPYARGAFLPLRAAGERRFWTVELRDDERTVRAVRWVKLPRWAGAPATAAGPETQELTAPAAPDSAAFKK